MALGRVSFYQKQRFDNVMSNFALSGGFWYYKQRRDIASCYHW
jgi:hypothetical protein